MHRRYALLAACLVAGCADQTTIPTMRPAAVSEHAQRLSSAPDVGTAQRWRAFWATLSPRDRAAGSRIIASVYAESGERYAPARIAIVPGGFREGVTALVTTNPLDADGLIVVLSEVSADYRSLALASRVAAHPPALSPAEILEVRIDGSTFRSAAIPHHAGPHRRSRMVNDLERGALRSVEVDLPGIGRGRLLEFY